MYQQNRFTQGLSEFELVEDGPVAVKHWREHHVYKIAERQTPEQMRCPDLADVFGSHKLHAKSLKK